MEANSPLKAATNSYKTPKIAKKLLRLADPLVIAGVTAAGKNAVSEKIIDRGLHERVVTNTTRRPRNKESNGKDYWFTTENDMFELIKKKLMVEAEVINDEIYGCSLEAVLDVVKRGKKAILTLDVNGAQTVSRLVPSVRPFFLIPPSYTEWMIRLGSRSFISDGERNRRMRSAHKEIEVALRGNDFQVVVNNDLDETLSEIVSGIGSDFTSQGGPREAAKELADYIKNM